MRNFENSYESHLKDLDIKQSYQSGNMPDHHFLPQSQSETIEIPKISKGGEIRRSIEKIKILHQEINTEDIRNFLSRVKSGKSSWKFSSVLELEFRDCGISQETLSVVIDSLTEETKIWKLSVTGTSNMDELIENVCQVDTDYLNIEENQTKEMFLKTFCEFLLERKDVIPIKGLDLSYNSSLDNFDSLGEVINSEILEEVKLVDCGLKTKKLQNLRSTIMRSQVKIFDVSYNTEITSEDIKMFPSLLRRDKIEKLSLCGCDLYEEDVEGFTDSVYKNLEVESLDLSYNPELGSDGMYIVGESVRNMKCKELGLSGCSLDEQCVDSLTTSLNGHKLKSVDISDNPKLGGCMKKVVNFTKKSSIKHVNLSNCQLTYRQVDQLSDELSQQQVHVEVLNLSDVTTRLNSQYISSICKIVTFVERKIIICFPSTSQKMKQELQNELDKVKKKPPYILYEFKPNYIEEEFGCLNISGCPNDET